MIPNWHYSCEYFFNRSFLGKKKKKKGKRKWVAM
jgi:hypothetical protein